MSSLTTTICDGCGKRRAYTFWWCHVTMTNGGGEEQRDYPKDYCQTCWGKMLRGEKPEAPVYLSDKAPDGLTLENATDYMHSIGVPKDRKVVAITRLGDAFVDPMGAMKYAVVLEPSQNA